MNTELSDDEIGGHRRATRIMIALGLLIAAGVVVAAVVIANNASSQTSKDTPGRVTGATSVARRNLVETDTESGTLSYADPQTVYNRLNGTVTWLPSVGAVIRQGQALYRVDGEPVVLLNGTTPAYRPLKSTDKPGADILELNQALIALGYSGYGIVADDDWQDATTNAVDALQESLGEKVTGRIGLGQAVFLPGPQLISTIDATLGQTGSGGESPPASSAANASTAVAPPAPEFVSLEHTVVLGPTGASGTSGAIGATGGTGVAGAQRQGGKHKHSRARLTLRALEALIQAQLHELQAAEHSQSPSGGGNGGHGGAGNSGAGNSGAGNSGAGNSGAGNSGAVNSGSGTGNSGSGTGAGAHNGGGNAGGGGGGNATAILATSSTKLVVTVDLSASSQSEAVVGEPVTVEMPTGSTVNGTITAVSPVAQAASGSGSGNGNGGSGNGGGGGGGGGNGGSSSTIPVTVTLKGHHTGAGLDQATVSVNFAQAKAKHVLSVPVTALLATSGSSYAVQEATAPHKLIPVTVGLFAAGYVQISGPGIYPGLSVTDSQG